MTITVNLTIPVGKKAKLTRKHQDGRMETSLLDEGQHHTAFWDTCSLELSEVAGDKPASEVAYATQEG